MSTTLRSPLVVLLLLRQKRGSLRRRRSFFHHCPIGLWRGVVEDRFGCGVAFLARFRASDRGRGVKEGGGLGFRQGLYRREVCRGVDVIGFFARVFFFVRLRATQFTFLQEGDSRRRGGGGVVGFGFQFGGLEKRHVVGGFSEGLLGVRPIVEGGGGFA
jgi:hypothetical protein